MGNKRCSDDIDTCCLEALKWANANVYSVKMLVNETRLMCKEKTCMGTRSLLGE